MASQDTDKFPFHCIRLSRTFAELSQQLANSVTHSKTRYLLVSENAKRSSLTLPPVVSGCFQGSYFHILSSQSSHTTRPFVVCLTTKMFSLLQLVLGCIKAEFCKYIVLFNIFHLNLSYVGEHFTEFGRNRRMS
jgi:hypothetical protein